MSWSSHLFFKQFKPDNIPSFDSLEDVIEILNSDENYSLYCPSNRGYIPWKIECIAEEYKSPLFYSVSCKNSSSEAQQAPVLLNSNQIIELIEFLSYVLGRFEASPKEAMQFDEDGYSESDILEQLENSKTFEKVWDDDDGSSPAAMFAFLRLFKSFCENAHQNGNVIIFANDSC